MTEIQRIDDLLKRAFEKEIWYGPALMEVLEDVNAKMAFSKPIKEAHSIWEIVLHIASWDDVVARRLKGEKIEYKDVTDFTTISDGSENAWKKALNQLEQNHQKLRHTIREMNDSDLEKIATGQEYSNYFMIHGSIHHYIYHAGQIALLKKAMK